MNRRAVLILPSVAALGLVLPNRRAVAQKDAISPEMLTLSTYVSQASQQPLPAEVAEQAKHHLIDTFAAIISGSRLRPGKSAIRYVRTHAGKGARTVIASNLTAGAVDAALAN